MPIFALLDVVELDNWYERVPCFAITFVDDCADRKDEEWLVRS